MPGAGKREEWAVTANGYKGSNWGEKNVLKLDSDDGCTALLKALKGDVYFKQVNFMVPELYPN